MRYQYRFIDYNKNITLGHDFDSEGGYAYVEAGDIWEMFVSSPQFGYEHRSALKNKFY